MADFTELHVEDGVGDWHFNRFRIAFEPPKGRNLVILANSLIGFFPQFVTSEYATAEWGEHKHGDLRTVRFHGYGKVLGIDLAAPHTDWVAIVSVDPNGFTVQTLKREFGNYHEDVGGQPGAPLGLVFAHYNRMHFLAGRRAWRVDSGSVFGLSNNIMALETVAVERFSAKVYDIADSVIGVEKRLPDVWVAFLNNFVDQMGLKPVDQALKPKWKKDTRAMYYQRSFDNIVGLMADPEFLNAYKLYPRILGN